MAIIMDTLQPGGEFPVADAKHISIESAAGDILNLKEFLLSTPEVGDDITIEVAREASADGTYRVAVGFSARSRLPGGCSVLLSWRNSANVLVATVNQSGITGHGTVITNLPIGLYSYTLAISNPNGTETRTGEVAVGSITFSTPAFDTNFNSSFFTANTQASLLLSGTVATAYNTSAIRAALSIIRTDTGVPVEALSIDGETYTSEIIINIPDSASAPGKSINFKELGFYFTPVALDQGEYATTYRLSLKMIAEELMADGELKEHISDPVNYETAVMTASTVVLLTEGVTITSLNNLRAATIPVKMLTSSNTVRASGTQVVCNFYSVEGFLLGSTYPTVTLYHGILTEIPIVTPNTLIQNQSGITLKIEPRTNIAGIENIQNITFNNINFIFEESKYVIDTSKIVANFNFTNSIDAGSGAISEKVFTCSDQITKGEYKLVLSTPSEYLTAAASATDNSTVTYLNINPNTYAALYRKADSGDWVEWDPVHQLLDNTQVGGITLELGFKSFENECVLVGNGINITSNKATVNFAAPLSTAMTEGDWHHLLISHDAVKYESSEEANKALKLKASIYLDGVLVAGHKSNYTATAGLPMVINSDGAVASKAALGLQYLRIHSKAFTPDEALKNFLASGTISQLEAEEQKSKLTKIYFISDYFDSKPHREVPGEFYKKKYPMRETSFSVLNSITEKTPDGKNIIVASKNTFVPCTVAYSYIDDNGEEQIEIWAKGISGAFDDKDDDIPVARNFLQGTSTLRYPIKNYQIKLTSKKKPPTIADDDTSWLADKVYTLKCDFMEQSHRNNSPTACFYQDNIVTAIEAGKIGTSSVGGTAVLSPAANIKEIDSNGNEYRKYRDAINGFPVEVYFVDTQDCRDKLCEQDNDGNWTIPNKDKYKKFIHTNLAAFTALGSYMFNVDKEGKQLGFCISQSDTKVTDIGPAADFSHLNLPEDDKLNFRAIRKPDGEYAYALKGNCTVIDAAKNKYTAFGNTIITDGEAPVEDSDCGLHWVREGTEYKLQVTCSYLPCVSYEGATNENAAAAAFVPFNARWDRYLALCWENGTKIKDSNKKTFYYRATHEPANSTDKVYTTTIDAQTGNEVYVASGEACLPITFDEFKEIIESEEYINYSAADAIVSDDGVLVGQKLALVLSNPEYVDAQGSDEIGYLEATLDPRFSFTDDIKISFTTVHENTSLVADIAEVLGEDAEDNIENYFKFDPIKNAINWVYARYNEIFSTDAKIASAGLTKFKEEFKKYFSLEYCIAYYLQMIVFAQVDNAGKNAMYDTWGDGKLYPRPYDMDTQVGLNNRGQDNVLTYAEMSMETSPIFKNFAATSVSNWADTAQRHSGDRFSFYNTSESALWKSFYKAFTNEICSTYFAQRVPGGIYDLDVIMRAIDGMTSDKISKATYNLDAINKFFDTSKQSNLHCIAGSRRDRYYNYMLERLSFLDTLFYAYSTSGADNSISTIVTPSANSYFAFAAKHPQYVYVNLDTRRYAAILLRPEDVYEDKDGAKQRGVRLSFSTTDASTAQNKNTDIYCCKYLTRLDGLTSFGSIDKLDMTNLENITELDLSNTAIKEMKISPSLTKINISQASATSTKGYEGELDLSSCVNLQEVIATNATKLTGIKLPEGAPIRRLELANTGITSLVLKGLSQLTTDNININGCKNITEISIVNCANIYSVPELPFNMPSTLNKCTVSGCPKFLYLDLQSRIIKQLTLDSSIHTLLLTSSTISDIEGGSLDLSHCTNLTRLEANSVYASGDGCTLILPRARYYQDVEFPEVTKIVYSTYQPNTAVNTRILDTFVIESPLAYDGWNTIPSDSVPSSGRRRNYCRYTASGIFKTFKISGSNFSAVRTTADGDAGVYDFLNVPFGIFRSDGAYEIRNTTMSVVKNLIINHDLHSLFTNCKTLVTIDDSCKLQTVGDTLNGLFQNCSKLKNVNLDRIMDVESRARITTAGSLFYGAGAISLNTVQSAINSLPNLQSLVHALRDSMFGVTEINLNELFAYSGTERIHKNLTDISMLLYSSGITRLYGTLPASVTNVSTAFAHAKLAYVSNDIFSQCDQLANVSNAFFGCRLGSGLSEEEKRTCIVSGNNETRPIFHENARANTLTSVKALFSGNTDLEKTDYLANIFGVCPRVVYADMVFRNCKKINILTADDFNCHLFDAFPNVYFADNMLCGTGTENFPTYLGIASNLLSARGLFANIAFSADTGTIEIPSSWLSGSMPNVRFIGTSGNISETVAVGDDVALFNSYKAEQNLGSDILPFGYKREDAHRPGASDSWQNDVAPGILSGSYLKSGIILIPIDILTGLEKLIDCSAAFASYQLSGDTFNLNKNLGHIFYYPQGADVANITLIPASVKSCAYCFTGITCALANENFPEIFKFNINSNSSLENAAGLFYKVNFSGTVTPGTLLTRVLGKANDQLLTYSNLRSIENIFSKAIFKEDVPFDISGYKLLMPKLRNASGIFRNISAITGTVSNLFFDSCRSTLILARYAFNGTGIERIGTGSYTSTETLKYAALAKTNTSWYFDATKTGYMNAWWSNHFRLLQQGLLNNLVLESRNLVTTSPKLVLVNNMITTGRALTSDGYVPDPNVSVTVDGTKIYALGINLANAPKTIVDKDVGIDSMWFKATYDLISGGYIWSQATTTEVLDFLKGMGCTGWFASAADFYEITDGLLTYTDDMSAVRMLSEEELCSEIYNVLVTNSGESLQNKVHIDLVSKENFMTYEAHLKAKTECKPVENGIFSNCDNLVDIAFCFANCVNLEGAIPPDCIIGSSKLSNISALFAFDTAMCNEGEASQRLRVNSTEVALDNTGAGTAASVYPKMRTLYNADLMEAGLCPLEAVPTNTQDAENFHNGYLVPEDFVSGLKALKNISGIFLATGVQNLKGLLLNGDTQGNNFSIAKLLFSDKTFSGLNSLTNVKMAFMLLQSLYDVRLGNEIDIFSESSGSIENMESVFAGMSVKSLKFLKPNTRYSNLKVIKDATTRLNRFRAGASNYSVSTNEGDEITQIGYPSDWAEDTGLTTLTSRIAAVASFKDRSRFPNMPIVDTSSNILYALDGFFSEVDWRDNQAQLVDHGILRIMCQEVIRSTPWSTWVAADTTWVPDDTLSLLDNAYNITTLVAKNLL